MCCESDGWVMPTRRAARVNDPSSTTATKHSSARKFIGRSYRIDGWSEHLTYRTKDKKLDLVRVTGINHVSISASDLEESTRFYVDVFGMEPIATPIFATRVQWLRCGGLQLHLFLDDSGAAPPARHHLGLTVDDFDAAYDVVANWTSSEWGNDLVELPSGQVQLYFRDPAGNLIELNWSDASTLDRSRYPQLRRLVDVVPQSEESLTAVLYLEPAPA